MIIKISSNFQFRETSIYNLKFIKYPKPYSKQLINNLNQHILNYIIESLPTFFHDNKLKTSALEEDYIQINEEKEYDIAIKVNAKKNDNGVIKNLSIAIIV